MVLLSMRAGQLVPEHVSKATVTLHAILGHVTLFAGSFPTQNVRQITSQATVLWWLHYNWLLGRLVEAARGTVSLSAPG